MNGMKNGVVGARCIGNHAKHQRPEKQKETERATCTGLGARAEDRPHLFDSPTLPQGQDSSSLSSH